MSKVRQLLASALIFVVATCAATSAQSLADVARKEEERRKGVKQPAKVYTNDDLKAARAPERPGTAPGAQAAAPQPPPASTVPPDQAPASPSSSAAGQDKTSNTAEAAVKRDEAYWRKRIADARTALDRSKVFLEALQSRINALTADFVARDDPAQRAVIAADKQRALSEFERLKLEIQEQTKAIAEIEEEARRAGVPAGWLR